MYCLFYKNFCNDCTFVHTQYNRKGGAEREIEGE